MPLIRSLYGSTGSSTGQPPSARIVAASREDADFPTGPTGAPWKGFLDVRLNNGPVTRRVLTESHVILGRLPDVQVVLDHHTVSRRHAEMFCDPFGRWWIRDLGSTNGTLVNDEPVTEHVLSPGDRVAVGDFNIAFSREHHDGARPEPVSAPVEFEKPTNISTLLDYEPPRIAAEHLRTLLEWSRRLIDMNSAEDRLRGVCELVLRSDFHATAAMVLRITSRTATRITPTYLPGGRTGDDRAHVSRRVLHAVRETREPVLGGSAHPSGGSAVELTIAQDLSVIACPLRIAGDEIDVLYVTLPPFLGSVEWLSLFALVAEVYQQSEAAWSARQHAQAHAAIERELGTARQIQHALLPTHLDFPGLDVAVVFEPCKWVGGDYVDAVPLLDGRLLVAVADVCGKGLQAALVTSSLHTMVRAAIDSRPSLPELMERVNRYLCEWLPADSFVTMIATAIDMETGELECVNAGHPPVMIVDRDGDLRCLQSAANPALGVALAEMESQRALFEFGDVLFMYTDGLTELRNSDKEMLGEDRLGEELARICAANPGETSASMAEALRKMLEGFRGEQLPEDDRAFVLAQRSR